MRMKTCVFFTVLFILFNSWLYAGEVVISWNANTETDLDHYNIYKATLKEYTPASKTATFNPWAKLAEVPKPTVTYTDVSDIDKNVAYQVTAVNASGDESQPSNMAYIFGPGPASVKDLKVNQ